MEEQKQTETANAAEQQEKDLREEQERKAPETAEGGVKSSNEIGAPREDQDVPKEQRGEFSVNIDDSHRYTDVIATEYRTVGGAHSHYVIKRKDGAILGDLKFQDGAIKEAGVNGVMDENLLAIVIDRLTGFQAGPYACKENEVALSKVKLALSVLNERTAARIARGVEGTHQK